MTSTTGCCAATRTAWRRRRQLLGRGSGAVDHLCAARDGFIIHPSVDRAVLRRSAVPVFDDTVTTGARAQSAATDLRLVGARVVGILAVGRALAPAPDRARDGRWQLRRQVI